MDKELKRFDGRADDFHFPLCNKCTHDRGNASCKAFPGGIPIEILSGQADHRESFPGDNGIHFEPSDI